MFALPRSIASRSVAACWLALAAVTCAAAELEVRVVDDRGAPLASVAVFLTPAAGTASQEPVPESREAVMDQQNQRFNPHVLVVEAGTSVRFPNNDVVSHHVYSFSPARPFELGLYKGNVYPPVLFDKAGLVVVGCNIHDGMLGYILVVDTPHFSLSDDRGVARIDVPPGEYSLEVWTPRARPSGLPAASAVTVANAGATAVDVRVAGKIAPPHDAGGAGLSWRHY